MLGVWIEPVTAQVMMTFPWGADMLWILIWEAAMAITHLERRRIEAGVLVPLLQAFQRAFGKERANEVAREVIRELARQDGSRWAGQFGQGLEALRKVAEVWSAGGALELQPLAAGADRLEFNVTRCRYAELFQELGLPELGALIHCSRDFAMAEGFSGDIELKRTQTLMQGAPHCDFRFKTKSGSEPE
jgi:predicted ArsR family transcriptional regulator